MLLVWFSVKTVLLTLCLTKCNTKFVFFFLLYVIFYFCTLSIKRKKRAEKKVLKNNLKAYLNSITVIILPFKENPNFQVILNWILQILLLHCSKQHRNIEKLLFIEQNIVSLSALLSVYCDLCFFCFSQGQIFSSSWTQYSVKVITCAVAKKPCLQ